MAYRIGRQAVPEFPQRKRLSWDDRLAVVAQLARLAGDRRRPDGAQLAAVAARHHVDVRSVQRWWADPRLHRPEDAAPRRVRFEITEEHLTVIASVSNYQDAYDHLIATQQLSVSRATFYRALFERTDPGLLAAAREGETGLRRYRMHMRYSAPHFNHTMHMDATQADVYVWPSHRENRPIRPWVYVCVDSATGFTSMYPFKERPTAEMVASVIVERTLERTVDGVQVGGIPEQIVCDNAAEHFATSIQEGASQLGLVFAPTTPYSPWQNGKAERALGLMNQKLAVKLPGAVHAGTRRDGSPRQMAKLPADIRPEEVLTWDAFGLLLPLFTDQLNTKYKVQRLGGRTRLQAVADDNTARRFLSERQVRAAMMRTARPHACNRDGFSFRGHVYTPIPSETAEASGVLGQGFRVGDYYQIRFLPTQDAFIEVYDSSGNYVGRAVQSHSMTKEQKDLLLLNRARQDRVARAIESGAIEHGRHLAASVNQQYGHEVDDYNEFDAALSELAALNSSAATQTEDDPTPVPESDPAIDTDVDSDPVIHDRLLDALPDSSVQATGRDETAAATSGPADGEPVLPAAARSDGERRNRRAQPPTLHRTEKVAPKRAALPRVPVTRGPSANEPNRQRTVDRLAARMQDLFGEDTPDDTDGP